METRLRKAGAMSAADRMAASLRVGKQRKELLSLGKNLAAVGGLYLAFELGDKFARDVYWGEPEWTPGRGKPAPEIP